ncbi:Tfp pilus assembly protein PilW-like protein [Candidatus Accumulibacter phosphatis]|uniref:Tfp pilus assembly protein PilW-like protein n=2 Tax=Betaproteobacteria incertae sedis TaxID=119066 RepID=C7RP50_ACCRE
MTMRHSRRPGANSRQRGLTLVEVMVAMTIGIILLLALGTLFANSTRVFKVNDDFARMQENGTYALNAIGSDLRQAGFYGHIASFDVKMPVAIAVTGDCAAGWATNVAQPLSGFHGVTPSAAHTALTCINASNFIDGAAGRPSFILIVRGATGGAVPSAALAAGSLYVQSDPTTGILFRGDQYAALATPPRRTVLGGGEAPIYPYQARAYYLRPCSRPTGSGGTVCLATDDGNQPIPTLVRQELVDVAGTTTMAERAVAEGIEAVRIVYGVDNDGNGTPDRYMEAPTEIQFTQVVTARVSVLVRSPKPTNGYNDDSRDYDLNGDGVAELNCTDDGLPCNYHRHVFTQSFQVRNIAQRLALP